MEFKTASVEELERYAATKREELRALRFAGAGSKNKNVKLPKTLRREIARAETELTAKLAGADI